MEWILKQSLFFVIIKKVVSKDSGFDVWAFDIVFFLALFELEEFEGLFWKFLVHGIFEAL
jgi:hypothetical protein